MENNQKVSSQSTAFEPEEPEQLFELKINF